MKQNIRLIKQEIWFDKIEPFAQIEIMKIIALNGFLSKKGIELKKEKTSQKLVDAIVNKMLDENNNLIQPVKSEKEEGTKKSTFYSLTERGIKILIEKYFEKNKKNDKKGISGKKYLNLDEVVIFINRYKKDYIDQTDKKFSEWEPPKLTKEDIRILYSGKDSSLYIKLIELTVNNTSKLKKLIKQFRDAEQKIDDALDQIPEALYEALVPQK